ncbi:hypothetical protein BDN71DRAFT_85309 [Pleurotus eryngii]|uniref:F-box domain-containing protein n=1 Tax=Pleurotus eryngii TaxID=5323 RepID=A0A9P6DD01_PLEER|nr:hypothetical protein BDN71DRAFT_85309 [Pleurotus eryngii]
MESPATATQQEMCRTRAEEHNLRFSATRTLPVEILCQIFRIIFTSHSGRRLSLYVTHVCRAWRSAALDDPHLWTDLTKLTGCNHDLARDLIARSKDLPVDIAYWGDEHNADTFSSPVSSLKLDLISTPHRFRALSFMCPDDDFLAKFVYPTTSLIRLRFGCGVCTIPPNFLGGFAPRLRHLSFEHINITPVTQWMQNIHTLHVFSNPLARGDAAQKALTDALEAMPLLEFLSLTSHKPAHDLPLSVPKAIRLIHLTRIDLTTDFSQILDCISCPNLLILHITCPRLNVCANIIHTAKFFAETTGVTLTSVSWATRGRLRKICIWEASRDRRLIINGCRVSIPDNILNDMTAIFPTLSALQLYSADIIPFPLCNLPTITDLTLRDGHAFLFEGDIADNFFPGLKRLTYEKTLIDVELVGKLTRWMDQRETALEALTFQKYGGLTRELIATLEQRSAVRCEGCHIDCRRGHTQMSEIALCTCLRESSMISVFLCH